MSKLLNVPEKLTVDWLLNVVDLEFKGYIPSAVAFEFFSFIRLSLGEEPENANPLAHYFLIDTIFQQDNVEYYYKERGIDYQDLKGRTAIMCCREFSKSTLVGTYLPLFMAWKGEIPGYGKVNYGLYIGDSMRNNVKTTMNTIEKVFLESTWLLDQFEMYRFTDEVMELVRHPRTPKEIAEYKKYTEMGKKKEQVPGRSKRTFSMKGVGAMALPLDATLYTEDGTTTIGECEVGDMIYGADGKLCTITKKSEVFYKPMYKINLEDGRSIDVSEDHINSIVQKTVPSRKTEFKTVYEKMDVTTTELLEMKMFHTRNRNGTVHNERLLFIENCNSLQYLDKAVTVDPYTLGVFLGDGTIKKNKKSVRVTCHVSDLPTYQEHIPYELGEMQSDSRNPNVKTFTILGIGKYVDELGLSVNSYEKFIPKEYFYCSENQRLSLLQGLIDTDGTVSKDRGKARYVSTAKQLAYDVANLVRSLGGRASVAERECSTKVTYIDNREVVSRRNTFIVYIWLDMPIARLERKCSMQTHDTTIYGKYVAIMSIEKIDMVPSQCIAVDNEEHQFITGDYVRTHNTGTRGTRSGLQRPQFAIFDDLVPSESDANSDAVLTNIEYTIDSDVMQALHGAGSFAMIIGTPYNKRDPVYQRLESGSWVPVVFPICKDINMDMTKEEFKSVWSDRHSYEKVMKRYKSAVREDKLRSFNQELMLRISSEADRLIPDSYINWFKRSDIIHNGADYNWYISTDFTTDGKKGNDFSGMAVWAVNSNHDLMLVDLSLKKLDLPEQYRELFRMVNRYKRFTWNIEVGIETDGQQKIHIYAIKQMMAKNNEYFTIGRQKGSTNEGISSGGVKKFTRFKGSAVPLFQNGKIWFAEDIKATADMQELLSELQYTTYQGFGSGHDDGCDLITQIGLMETYAPSSVNKQTQHPKDAMWWETEEESGNAGLNSYIV
jgi:hypothetical protein